MKSFPSSDAIIGMICRHRIAYLEYQTHLHHPNQPTVTPLLTRPDCLFTAQFFSFALLTHTNGAEQGFLSTDDLF